MTSLYKRERYPYGVTPIALVVNRSFSSTTKRRRFASFSRATLFLCMVLISVVVVSCTSSHRKLNKQTKPPALWVDENTPVFFCWFVIHGPKGQHGYACADATIAENPPYSPEAGGLFASINDLRTALKTIGAKAKRVVPTFPERIPNGWEVRDLNTEELRVLKEQLKELNKRSFTVP